jgi:hypothetical protein
MICSPTQVVSLVSIFFDRSVAGGRPEIAGSR